MIYEYESTVLKQEIIINRLVTIHYFEYMSDFEFRGEAHDFWEFLCIDKGEVEVQADDRVYHLSKGDIIFHKPMEFHTIKANGITAPNLVVITFESKSRSMSFFRDKVLSLGESEWDLIGKIIIEAQNAYKKPLNVLSFERFEENLEAPFGAQQLIKLYLEQLLISLVRKAYLYQTTNRKIGTYIKEKSDSNILNCIQFYLENNITKPITVEEICKEHSVSRSYLQQLFNKHHNCGVMAYFNTLKIDTAKQMIRCKNMNFTEISYYLGYPSIHSFSKQFKRITGMNPSEYASSIKMRGGV